MDDTGNRTGAARAYYGLVMASVLIPLLVFLGGSWLAWTSTLREAHAELERTLSVSAEQATKVLDTHLLIAERVNDLLRGMDDAAVIGHVSALRDDIDEIIRRFPHVTNVAVTDSQGRTLLSTPGHAADQSVGAGALAYINALHDPHVPFFIGTTVADRSADRPAVAVGYRRGDDPQHFQGVILVSVSSGYFEALDRTLFGGSADYTAGILREDGTCLARYPLPPDADRNTAQDEPLLQAIKLDPIGGTFQGKSSLDGRDWLVDYRKLDAYPVYASVGRSWNSIVHEWRDAMATHLIFGIPATLGLLALSCWRRGSGAVTARTLAELQD